MIDFSVKKRIQFITVICTVSTFALHAQNDEFFTVNQTVWTNGIDQDFEHKTVFEDEITSDRQFFWMHLKGNQALLDFMKEHNELPVRFKWFRMSMLSTPFPKIQNPNNELKRSANPEQLLQDFQKQINDHGSFDLRIWDSEDYPTGKIRIKIVFLDNDLVNCGGKDCLFDIEVN